MPAQDKGRAKDRTNDGPNKRKHRHRDQDRRGQHHHRGFDAQALPGDHHLARTIGEPGRAERQQADHDEKNDDADHCDTGLPSAASASAAMRRLAASAASRASTFLTQLCAADARRLRQRGDVGKRSCDIAARCVGVDAGAISDDASSPGGAPPVSIGVNEQFCAWPSSLPRIRGVSSRCRRRLQSAGISVANSRPSCCGAWHAIGGEWRERRELRSIGTERLHRGNSA